MTTRPWSRITKLQVAIILTVLATIFGMIASAMHANSDGGVFETWLHSNAQIVMLVAYVYLIAMLIMANRNRVPELQVVDQKDLLEVFPCLPSNLFFFNQASIDDPKLASLHRVPYTLRKNIRILVAKGLRISEAFNNVLPLFPNAVIVDFQNSIIDHPVWDSLEELARMDYVLVNEAIDPKHLIHYSLSYPEVKFVLEPKQIAISISATMPVIQKAG